MHGLATIRTINEHAARVHEEKQRRAAGVKPRGVIGRVIRDSIAHPEKSLNTAGVKRVLMQGQYVEV